MLNTIINADVLSGLAQLPAELVHCCITSPPYWRLRSYPGIEPTQWADGQCVCLGAESDPESFIRHLVEVFAGVWRVLRSDGVLFVNIGETYANTGGGGDKCGPNCAVGNIQNSVMGKRPSQKPPSGLKNGDRCGIPERFALAMQAAGWCWRDTIIWAKKSPMPSSQFGWRWVRCRRKVSGGNRGREEWRIGAMGEKPQQDHNGRDFAPSAKWADCPGCKKCRATNGLILRKGRFRTTAAHEPIFMFAKGERYFMDDRGAAEPVTGGAHFRGSSPDTPKGRAKTAEGHGWQGWDQSAAAMVENRNPRSWWPLSSEPTKEKHFAAYPTALVKKCMDMATSKAGCCGKCGSPYAPIVESERVPTRPGTNHKGDEALANRNPQRHIQITRAMGYLPTCSCDAASVPCRVLDPFMGSGTTARVAHHTGRDWVGIEGSKDYIPIAERRILVPLPSKKAKKKPRPKLNGQQELFVR
jgi:DNA modification methylase